MNTSYNRRLNLFVLTRRHMKRLLINYKFTTTERRFVKCQRKQVLRLFEKYGVFDYLRTFYDVLHTTGYQYINHDIDLYLQARNCVL